MNVKAVIFQVRIDDGLFLSVPDLYRPVHALLLHNVPIDHEDFA
jgi:hypothetical protein